MSLFKKPSRKFRPRKAGSDSDDEVKDVAAQSADRESKPAPIVAAKVVCESEEIGNKDCGNRDGKAKNKLKLSFDEEEDADTVFKVKKSAYSRRMGKYFEKEKKKRDKETVKEPIKPMKPLDEDLKGSVRKKMEKEREELNIKWIPNQIKQESEVVEEVELEGSEDEESDDNRDIRHENSDSMFPQFRGVLERGVIPDAKTIYALKKQRQMARDTAEFISVESDAKYDDNSSSRLAREEDSNKSGEEDDEDEDDDRIDFAVDKEALEKEKAREAFLQAQEEEENKDDYESDDELEKWEREQIRKGVGAHLLSSALGSAQTTDDSNSAISTRGTILDFKRKSKTIPDHLLKERKRLSRSDVIQKLTQIVNVMKLNVESNERYVVNIDIEIEQSVATIKRLEYEISKLRTKCESLKTVMSEGSSEAL